MWEGVGRAGDSNGGKTGIKQLIFFLNEFPGFSQGNIYAQNVTWGRSIEKDKSPEA